MGEVFFLVLLAVFVYLAIAVHELGHYLVLKRFGVRVRAVAFGGPPWVFRWKRGDTEFRVGLLPLFAFVEPEEWGLNRLPLWRFVAGLLAGPAANFGAALVGVLVLTLLQGGEAFVKGVSTVLFFPVILAEGVRALVQSGGDAVVGFRDFAEVSVTLMRQGVAQTVVLWVALNTALGWFNLIPLPPLDGGQAVARLFERYRWFTPVYRGVLVVGVGLNVLLLVLALLKDLGLWR